MFIPIDPTCGLAIYEQVVRQVKFAVAAGAVKPGEAVPSVRELARQLAINPNTVARAYRDLQTEGVLDSVRGTRLVVAPGAVDLCRRQRVLLIRQRLRQVLLEAKYSLLDGVELRELVENELAAIEHQEA